MEATGGDEPSQKAQVEEGGGGGGGGRGSDNGSVGSGGGGGNGGGGAAAAGAGGGSAKEERIQVSVRLRPLNAKELARNDPSDWECINDTTIIFHNSLPERSMFPTAYTFDRVFRYDSTTKRVYEEGAKEVALSVVGGINASIFAYGQTSSGKTYTMTGITEYAVTDIYDYTQRHKEREFVLKFSAMEIYNEAVRDLLSADSTPLRLLDDPDRGTTVEKLTEETLRDWDHMKELLSICEAQRQIGETSFNEMSSRSHQILRLSVESSAREFLGKDNSSSLAATVNFVDLAGSERASQTMSAGTRLKEGCHINRSLLTLGTVIRKLSKGRTGHIPYRDSKLTRILQPSLGGNARTAVICTMSPARSHVEQSRNTLLFANCAKEVATSAHVNVLMSDKALVKHLQKELARLESELRCSGLNSNKSFTEALLKEKDAQIQKMEREIKELMRQRDAAQSRIEDLIRAVGDDGDELHSLSDSSSVFDFGLIKPNASPQSFHDSANCSDGFPEHLDNSSEHDAASTQNSVNNTSSVGSTPRKYQELITQDDHLDIKNLCKEELSDNSNEHDATSTQNLTINTDSVGSAPHEGQELITQDVRLDMKDLSKEELLGNSNKHHATSNEHDATSSQNSTNNTNSVGSAPHEGRELTTQDVCLVMKDLSKEELFDNSNEHNAISIRNAIGKTSSVGSAPHKDRKLITQDDNLDMKDVCREVRCIEVDDTSTGRCGQPHGLLTEESDSPVAFTTCDNDLRDQETVTKLKRDNDMDVRESIDHFVKECPNDSLPWPSIQALSASRSLVLTRSRSCKASLMNSSTSRWFLEEKNENTPLSSYFKDFSGRPEGLQRSLSPPNYNAENEAPSEDGSQTSARASLDLPKPDIIKTDPEVDITSVRTFVAELKEMAETQFQKQLNDGQVVDHKDTHDMKIEQSLKDIVLDVTINSREAPRWTTEFERQQREIIELWHTCHVSLVHRTYFFLLFKGDHADSMYMEVELRRLSFVRQVFSEGNLDRSMVENGCNVSLASSMKALRRERGMLCRQMQKRLSAEERDSLFRKWGIPLQSKQRKMQLTCLLWSDTGNMDHIRESASVVATLIGLLEPDQALKEMFELSFTPQRISRRSQSWKHGMSSIL